MEVEQVQQRPKAGEAGAKYTPPTELSLPDIKQAVVDKIFNSIKDFL